MKLWERMSQIIDAADCLDAAKSYIEDHELDWPAFGAWIDAISGAHAVVMALQSHPEIAKAIADEQAEDDRLGDLSDAASY